jgi:DNA-directed RNA polymerase specialized sigma24 family protein
VAEPLQAGEDGEPELALRARLQDGELWAHARRLPDKQRQALALRVLLELPYAEIGAVMQTSAAAARRNVFEALTKLRPAASNEMEQR